MRHQLRQELAQSPIPKLEELILIDKDGTIIHFFP